MILNIFGKWKEIGGICSPRELIMRKSLAGVSRYNWRECLASPCFIFGVGACHGIRFYRFIKDFTALSTMEQA